MNRSDWTELIESACRGETSVSVTDGRSEEREGYHSALVRYRELAITERPEFERALAGSITRATRLLHAPQNAGWAFLEQLLLLARHVQRGSRATGELIDACVDALAATQRFPSAGHVAYRTMQALIGLEFRGNVEFWRTHYRSDHAPVAAATIVGLASLSQEQLLTWLRHVDWTYHLAEAVSSTLPYLLENQGTKCAVRVVVIARRKLQVPNRKRLDRVVGALGLELDAASSQAAAEELAEYLDQFLRQPVASANDADSLNREVHSIRSAIPDPRNHLLLTAIGRLGGQWNARHCTPQYTTQLVKLMSLCNSPHTLGVALAIATRITEEHKESSSFMGPAEELTVRIVLAMVRDGMSQQLSMDPDDRAVVRTMIRRIIKTGIRSPSLAQECLWTMSLVLPPAEFAINAAMSLKARAILPEDFVAAIVEEYGLVEAAEVAAMTINVLRESTLDVLVVQVSRLLQQAGVRREELPTRAVKESFADKAMSEKALDEGFERLGGIS